jgi:hypothetical protein
MRKLAERQSYLRKVTVYRNSVDYQTGEITTRKRRANRRSRWMNGQAGFISLPDGENSAYELARLLRWHAAQSVAQMAANGRTSPFSKFPKLVGFAVT